MGVVLWVLLAAALIAIELSTTQLYFLWFAVGALAGAFAAFVGAPLPIQLALFLVCSVATFAVGRPMLVEKIMPKRMATSLEKIIGQCGVVTEEIAGSGGTGRISAGGLTWAAVSHDGTAIPLGEDVRILSREGVKLIVAHTPQEEASPQAGIPDAGNRDQAQSQ